MKFISTVIIDFFKGITSDRFRNLAVVIGTLLTLITFYDGCGRSEENSENPIINNWWMNLPNEWQNVFRKSVGFSDIPTDNQIEEIKALTHIDCSNTSIRSLEPLTELYNLKSLICSNTNVEDLSSLTEVNSLYLLDCSNTNINTLKPLFSLKKLEKLKCTNNKISLSEISELKKSNPNIKIVFN